MFNITYIYHIPLEYIPINQDNNSLTHIFIANVWPFIQQTLDGIQGTGDTLRRLRHSGKHNAPFLMGS